MAFAIISQHTEIKLPPRLTRGLEHFVYADQSAGLVYKRPNPIGGLWQPMDADTAQVDLEVFKAIGIPIVPTILFTNPEVILPGGRRARVPYVMQQPLVADKHDLHFTQLKEDVAVREQMLRLLRQSEELHERRPECGVDFLGGANWGMFVKAISPFTSLIRGDIPNIFVLNEDLASPRGMEALAPQGELLARAGEILLCDLRLLNSGLGRGPLPRIKGFIAGAATDIELGAMWEIFKTIDPGTEPPGKRSPLRMLGALVAIACMPKLQRYAAQFGYL